MKISSKNVQNIVQTSKKIPSLTFTVNLRLAPYAWNEGQSANHSDDTCPMAVWHKRPYQGNKIRGDPGGCQERIRNGYIKSQISIELIDCLAISGSKNSDTGLILHKQRFALAAEITLSNIVWLSTIAMLSASLERSGALEFAMWSWHGEVGGFRT